MRPGGCRWPALVVEAALALSAFPVPGQPIEELQLKTAIIFNLTKFVEWPPASFRSSTDPIAICVVGESPVSRTLQRAIQGKQVEDRTLVLRSVSEAKQAAGCHVLFVPSGRSRWRSIVTALKSSGVLTVGETDDFVSGGGMINLRTDGARVRIQVNVGAIESAGIKISSELLSLAQIVK